MASKTLYIQASLLALLLVCQTAQPSPVDYNELARSLRELLRVEALEEAKRAQDAPLVDPGITPLVKRGLQSPPLKIAAFNIQMFGRKKYEKEDVKEILLKILARYDLTLVQEIRDSRNESFPRLVEDLREIYPEVAYVLSARLGRTNSKEQYAYLYNSSRLQVVNKYVYHDSRDRFEREPYCVHFHSIDSAVSDFGVVGIHTTPREAEIEIDLLTQVYDNVVEEFETKNVILMGDFNADCSYVTKGEMGKMGLRSDPRFTWLIGDDVDTTVSRSHCAYDRFVIAGAALKKAVVPGSAKTYRFDQAYGLTPELTKAVSDHYPIEMELYGKGKEKVRFFCEDDEYPIEMELHGKGRYRAGYHPVSPVVRSPVTDEIFSVSSPASETSPHSSAMALQLLEPTTSSEQLQGFTPTVIDTEGSLTIQLEAIVDCKEVVSKLDALEEDNPGILSGAVVGLVDTYLSGGILDHAPSIPGLQENLEMGKQCKISIKYLAQEPYTYDVSVSKVVN